MRGQKRVEDARKRAYDPRIHQKAFRSTDRIARSSPAMTRDKSGPRPLQSSGTSAVQSASACIAAAYFAAAFILS
jgi:hypothetical protein